MLQHYLLLRPACLRAEQGQPCKSVYLPPIPTSIQLGTLPCSKQSASHQPRPGPYHHLFREKTSRREEGLTTMALRGQRAVLTSVMAAGPVFSSRCRASLARGKLTLMGKVASTSPILPQKPNTLMLLTLRCTACPLVPGEIYRSQSDSDGCHHDQRSTFSVPPCTIHHYFGVTTDAGGRDLETRRWPQVWLAGWLAGWFTGR